MASNSQLRRRGAGASTSARVRRAPGVSLRVAVLTVGTRGDVQPFVALGQYMQRRGHTVMVCTSRDFKGFVEGHGLQYADCGLETVVQPPEWLTCTSFYQMIRVTAEYMKASVDAIAVPIWEACRDFEPDVVLCMPLTLGFGKNIAEKMAVPCYVTQFAQSVVSSYYGDTYMPNASVVQRWRNWGRGVYNALSMVWHNRNGIVKQFAAWRRDVLKMEQNALVKELSMYRLPVLSAVSPTLFPIAPDFKPEVFVTGFWFLDAAKGDATVAGGAPGTAAGAGVAPSGASSAHVARSSGAAADHGTQSPTSSPLAPLPGAGAGAGAGAAASADGDALLPEHLRTFLTSIEPAKPVCINFGSMVAGGRQATFIARVVRVVAQQLQLPCVLVAGWNSFDRYQSEFASMAGRVCCVKSVPHEALFPRCSAVVYHGGSGTVARVLQAGVPSVVVPILKWSDQPQFGKELERAGVGVCVMEDSSDAAGGDAVAPAAFDVTLHGAVQRCVSDAAMQRTARVFSTRINNEFGIGIAASALENCLCERVRPGSSEDVEFCQRHCVPCTMKLRKGGVGVVKTKGLGWDVYYDPDKARLTAGQFLCRALVVIVCLFAPLFLFWRWATAGSDVDAAQ